MDVGRFLAGPGSSRTIRIGGTACYFIYEFFHGHNGAGIGASHQTGWTGIVATLIEIFGKIDGETF